MQNRYCNVEVIEWLTTKTFLLWDVALWRLVCTLGTNVSNESAAPSSEQSRKRAWTALMDSANFSDTLVLYTSLCGVIFWQTEILKTVTVPHGAKYGPYFFYFLSRNNMFLSLSQSNFSIMPARISVPLCVLLYLPFIWS
jgi:hypothetical protein